MSSFNPFNPPNQTGSTDEMQIRGDAPLLSQPSSPENRRVMRLEDIPEATPGPNAFAIEEARRNRYRLETNAFYQEEVQKRKMTPPTSVHPALRAKRNSAPPSPQHLSCGTTMSPFVEAGRENSPQLRLMPDSYVDAEPTQRGFIEENRKQILHDRSGSRRERIPVFIPTPKMANDGFENAAELPAHVPPMRTKKEEQVTEPPPKTPKKSFLDKLRLTTNLLGMSSPTNTAAQNEAEAEERIPVKAKAIFGASPSKKSRTSLGSSSPAKPNFGRSPSKRKGFFSRWNADVPTIDSAKANAVADHAAGQEPPSANTVVVKTPQTAFADPTYSSHQQGKPAAPQARAELSTNKEIQANANIVARSQSLKYFDHVAPPTPPAKNTPPEEKARKEAEQKMKASRLPFRDDQTTPSKSPTGIVSTNERVSPTKYGGYGRREVPTLVTRPSMYSLHASVVPNMTEAHQLDEMRARLDGLALEGFSMPDEHTRSPQLTQGYTPSIYSTEFSPRPNGTFAKFSPVSPMTPAEQSPRAKHLSTHSGSSSSGGVIPIIYPDLAKDPSFNRFPPVHNDEDDDTHGSSEQTLRPNVSDDHGYTHSRDHSNSPRHSINSSIFAAAIDEDHQAQTHASPTSFTHASATPSPLQLLPATTFTPPPPRKSSRRGLKRKTANIHTVAKQPSPPKPTKDLFTNAPTFPAAPTPPRNPIEEAVTTDLDPLKTSPTPAPAGVKLNTPSDLLTQLQARNTEVEWMRKNMQETNRRLDKRLAHTTTANTTNPTPKPKPNPHPKPTAGTSPSRLQHPTTTTTTVDVNEWGVREQRGKRVSTSTAQEFYRRPHPHLPQMQIQGQGQEGSDLPIPVSSETPTQTGQPSGEVEGAVTLEKLVEMNRALLQLCGGLSEKVGRLEERVGKGHGD